MAEDTSFTLTNVITEMVKTRHTIKLFADRLEVESLKEKLFSKKPSKSFVIPYSEITGVQHYRRWNFYYLGCGLLCGIIIPTIWAKLAMVAVTLVWAAKYDIRIALANGTEQTIRYSGVLKRKEVTDSLVERITAGSSAAPTGPKVIINVESGDMAPAPEKPREADCSENSPQEPVQEEPKLIEAEALQIEVPELPEAPEISEVEVELPAQNQANVMPAEELKPSEAKAAEPEAETVFCCQCGAQIKRTAKFCNFCGNKNSGV